MDNYTVCIVYLLSLNASIEEMGSNSALSNLLHCDIKDGLSLLKGFCITHSEMAGLIEVGNCMYSHSSSMDAYAKLPNDTSEFDELTCGKYNRTGTLCGQCKKGHYPLAYSFEMSCMKCSKRETKVNWWKFVLAAFAPLTVFYFLILFFRISITSSYLQGFVLYSQVLSTPQLARSLLVAIQEENLYSGTKRIFEVIGSLLGMWNLDLLRYFDLGICVDASSLQMAILDIAVGVYPILLMVLTYILISLHDQNIRPLVYCWKPFQAVFSALGRNLNIKTSLVDAFATFFLLSNFKFLSVSFDIFAPVRLYQINSTGHLITSWRLYIDSTVPYFGETHLPYAILGSSILMLLVVFPTVLLFVYPFRWFQKFLNLFPFRWYILHTFVDTFQGCYKDGTEPGTPDYRWIVSIFFLLRFLLLTTGLLTLGSAYFNLAPILLVLTALILVLFQPYKDSYKHVNSINVCFFLLLAVIHVCVVGLLKETLALLFFTAIILVLAISFLYTTVITLHWIYKHRNCGLKVFQRVKAQLYGYTRL